MSRQIQFRRGTADEHKNFTGAEGEITVDTTNKTIRVHDGVTAGGTMLARADALNGADYVIAWQTPTAENNYTWYRKYKSGWVEQGGNYNQRNTQIILPVKMQNNAYMVMLSFSTTSGNNSQYNSFSYTNKTCTGFVINNSGTVLGEWCAYGFCEQ